MRRKIRSLKNKIPKLDWRQYDCTLIFLVTALVIFGVVMVFSASYYYSINTSPDGSPYVFLKKEIVLAAVGFVLMFLCAHVIDYKFFGSMSRIILIISLGLLGAVLVPGIGSTANGATRWINIFGFTIMPGELAKPAILVFTAAYFAHDMRRAKHFFKGVLPVLMILGVMFVLIALQPNLSTALTVVLICGGIMFIAGLPVRHMLWLGGIGAGAIIVKVLSAGGYQADRVLSFLDPFEQAGGDGYQATQSLLALGTGGIGGVGIGKSVQKNLYLPEAQTDFILSIIGEELGFIGVVILLGVFFTIVYKCFVIASHAPDRFGMLTASGVGILIGLQVVFNVAIVTSSMPPTGIALPFISYGGNSLWIFMGLIGIVLNIDKKSREIERNSK